MESTIAAIFKRKRWHGQKSAKRNGEVAV